MKRNTHNLRGIEQKEMFVIQHKTNGKEWMASDKSFNLSNVR